MYREFESSCQDVSEELKWLDKRILKKVEFHYKLSEQSDWEASVNSTLKDEGYTVFDVGIEDVEDIIYDLDQALTKAVEGK